MSKRRRQDSAEWNDKDNPIGLTNAFEVIRDPQAVEYDEGDEAIGLTEAFGAVSGEEDVVHSWDKAGKWKDFDWDASAVEHVDFGAEDDAVDADADADEASGETDAEASKQAQPDDDFWGEVDASVSEQVEQTPTEVDEKPAVAMPPATTGKRGGRGRHAAPIPELSPRMKKSKRMRKTLVFIIILLVAVLGVVVYFGFRAFEDSQHEAAHQAQEQTAAPKEDIGSASQGDADSTTHLTEVPELTGLFGMNTKKAVKKIGHGAIVTSEQKSKGKDSAIKKEVTIALTEEPADSKTSTPKVYLGLDGSGNIVQVGYSASASALGFGSFSFSDAVNEKHVVEETFKLMGVDVPEGSASLPKDKKKYSTYGSDKTTVVKESYSFEGDTEVDGAPCTWSAVLSYDYTTQILTGNLSDTVRVIYAYLTKK